MRIFVWLFRAAVFFTLFAFALNNQHPATVRWFFGIEWTSPLVFVVLAAFAIGCAFGVIAMVPSWWRHRRVARAAAPEPAEDVQVPVTAPAELAPVHPPRDGL